MNCLIIEDSKTVAHIIRSTLSAYGYKATNNTSDEIADVSIKEGVYEVILVNTNLKKGNSIKVLKKVRSFSSSILIIGISDRGTWQERVEFLNLGADDVITYPFPVQELLARIQALLRRPKLSNGGRLYVGKVEIDTDLKSATKDTKDLCLRKKEYKLLEYMARNKNRTLTRAELIDHVWDYRKFTGSNTVDVHVKRLRDKLGDKSLIKTIHGFGYRIADKSKETLVPPTL